jgi:hypothetical protein
MESTWDLDPIKESMGDPCFDGEPTEPTWNWLVIWNIFYFSIHWEYNPKWLIFFQRGWNHQPGKLCFFCHKMSCSRRRLRRLPLQRTWCQRGCGPISGVYGESTVCWTPDDPTPYFVVASRVKHWDRWSYHLQFVDTLSLECVACISAFNIIQSLIAW